MSGKFKTFVGTTLTLGHPPGPDSLHEVAPTAAVTLDNQPAHMGDLKPDDEVELSGDPATIVTARRQSGSQPAPTAAQQTAAQQQASGRPFPRNPNLP